MQPLSYHLTWKWVEYKDKLSALEKYMLWTPNSDAVPDCALHNHHEIMRQKGGCWNRAWRDGVLGDHLHISPLHLTSAFYLWLALHSRFPLQSTVVQWNRVQANTSRLCCAPTKPCASQQQTIPWLGVAHARCELCPSTCIYSASTVWESVPVLVTALYCTGIWLQVDKHTGTFPMQKVTSQLAFQAIPI